MNCYFEVHSTKVLNGRTDCNENWHTRYIDGLMLTKNEVKNVLQFDCVTD